MLTVVPMVGDWGLHMDPQQNDLVSIQAHLFVHSMVEEAADAACGTKNTSSILEPSNTLTLSRNNTI